jgi:uncharacterized membrane protein (DUF485 family)
MNKKSDSRSWQIILSLIFLTGVIYLAWLCFSSLWLIFKGLQKEVAAALIVASATIVVSVITVIVAKYYERKRSIELEHRNKKIPMYEEFVEFLFKILMNEKLQGKQITEEEMMRFITIFTQKLIVWGSDDVVTHWSKYKKIYAKEDTPDAMLGMFQMEKLLLSIRKDTGHKNKSLKKGDILGLFINDIDKYL